DSCGAVDPCVVLRVGHAAELEREAHIGRNGHVWIKRIILKYHGDVALLRRHVIDHAIADAYFAGRNVFEACNHPQQGRFTAPGRPNQDDEFSVADRDIDALDYSRRAEGLVDIADCDGRHAFLPSPNMILLAARVDATYRAWELCASRRGTVDMPLPLETTESSGHDATDIRTLNKCQTNIHASSSKER